MAQSTLLAQCVRSGLTLDRILADDHPAPKRTELSYALATDDRMLFTTLPRDQADPVLQRFDATIRQANIQAHHGKDVDFAADGAAIGIDPCHGRYLVPHSPKLKKLLLALYHLCSTQCGVAAIELSSLLGHCTWFCASATPAVVSRSSGI